MANQTDDQQSPLPPGWVESDRFVPRSFVRPVLSFMRRETAGGIVMLAAAILAIAWANSPFADSYFDIFDATVEISFGGLQFHHLSELTVREWINDGAMVIFFFVVGLEIKREVTVGELREPRAAALPVLAAAGGMVLPAVIYLAFNIGGDFAGGWGIPMATDIAFAVAVVAMVGTRLPVGGKLFLLALAIVDDLGAIAVIAVVYTDTVSLAWLAAGVVGLAVVVMMNRAGIRALPAYVAMGALVWLCVLESGVHATVAGVALAFLTPVRSLYSPQRFPGRARTLVDRVEYYVPDDLHDLSQGDEHTTERVESVLGDLRRLSTETVSPQDRLELALAPWSAYVIVPVFALANAGVAISSDALAGLSTNPVALGVGLGLLLGKVTGILSFSWLAVRLGLGRLPHHTTWRHMTGMGLLAGIGFTVALFVASLAFEVPQAESAAKVGIFAGSILSGVLGFVLLRTGPAPDPPTRHAGA